MEILEMPARAGCDSRGVTTEQDSLWPLRSCQHPVHHLRRRAAREGYGDTVMCRTCGCASDVVTIDGMEPHTHDHAHHHHDDAVSAPGSRTVSLEQDLLAKNQLFAERNRGWFAARDVFTVNLMSSPGAGKTSILERTIFDLRDRLPVSVLEGDQATTADADRIRATGAAVVQINTGTGCHLDAHMVAHGVEHLKPPRGSLLLIENVGNLVCPAMFDLGEQARVVIVSVTEGDDKPLKYPYMFRAGDLLLINKMDLRPYVRFDVRRCIDLARRINPAMDVLLVSAETGEGMSAWYDWLQACHARVGTAALQS
jgi:hydrogenase nickel incorporation protein HypB